MVPFESAQELFLELRRIDEGTQSLPQWRLTRRRKEVVHQLALIMAQVIGSSRQPLDVSSIAAKLRQVAMEVTNPQKRKR